MHCTRKINNEIYWVGSNDRRLNLFENIFSIPDGVSYNSYLVCDEKTVLIDTVDYSVSRQYIENILYILNGSPLDYLIINHMEPDHCAVIPELCRMFPELKIIGNAKTFQMIKQFYGYESESRAHVVKEGDILTTGRHSFKFIFAPMVHWPEVMVSYDIKDKILFSADAFGSFGALSGNIFNDEIDFEKDWLDESRRYYSNIVGKYGASVQNLLKKASELDINAICPLHGPVWRSNLGLILDKYNKWSLYEPEENGVVIAYGSIYGHTQNAAECLAAKLADSGVKNISMYDVSCTDISYIISDMFKYGHIVLMSPTYNAGVFRPVETLVNDMKALNVQKRKVAVFENGSWAPAAAKQIIKVLEEMKDITLYDEKISIKSALTSEQGNEIYNLAEKIASEINQKG